MKKTIFALLATLMLAPTKTWAIHSENPFQDTNPANYHAAWSAQSDWPTMQTEEISTAWIKFTNTGSATWYNYGDHPVRLGTSHPLDRNSGFYKHTWISTNRPAKLKESEVAPGETGTFEFYLKAPTTPGVYQEYFQPVVEGVTWMDDWGVFLQITVEGTENSESNNDNQNGYHALWHSQSNEDISLNPGETASVWVKFTNTGDTNWYNSGSYPIHLGTDNPRDRSSSFYQNSWLSTNRSANLTESVVAPDEEGKFTFTIKAPNSTGTYREYFTPVAEGLTWIGTKGVYWDVTVGDGNEDNNTNENFNLTGYYSNGQVKLNWNNYTTIQTSENSNIIDGYKIVRSETSTSPVYPDDWWVYVTGAGTNSYSDASVVGGHTYHYRIGAYQSGTGVIEYTNHITIEIPANDNNDTNNDIYLDHSEHGSGLQLNWDTYTGVDGYKLLRSETDSNLTYPEDGYYKYISGQSSSSYVDTGVTNGHSYYYRIGAYDNGSIIAYSNTIHVTYNGNNSNVNENIFLSAENQNNNILLDWDTYSGVDGYKLLRSETDSNLTYPEDGYYKYISSQSISSYTDTGVTDGHDYYYRIGAYDNGSIIAYSNTIHITCEKDNSSSSDFGLSAENINSGIQLEWDIYTGSNISGYKILRSTSDNNLTYPEDGYYKYISNSSSTGYVDTNVNSGTRYYYRIAAYNGSAVAYTNTVEIYAD